VTTYHNDGLNPEPTPHQLTMLKLHKTFGTTPGNPSWYRDPGARFRRARRRRRTGFGPPRYPKMQTGTEARAYWLHSEQMAPDAFERARGRPMRKYIEAFRRARGLVGPWVDKP